jgi:transposase
MEQTSKKRTAKPYSAEFRERAVRLALEHRDESHSEAAALTAIAGKLGCSPDSLRVWTRQVQPDGCERPGPSSAENAWSEPLKAPLVQAQWRTSLSVRTGNCGRRTRSCTKLLRILPRRSSTAHFANDGFRFADLRFIEEWTCHVFVPHRVLV